MSLASENEGKKWIQTAVAVTCIFLAYITISFLNTISDWFQLETIIPNYSVIAQVVGVLVGIITFIVVFKNPISNEFLKDVYSEITKVGWPDREQTWSATIRIMIGVTIMGIIFWLFDIGANLLFTLVHE